MVLNETGAVLQNVVVTEELSAPNILKTYPHGVYSIGLPPAGDTREYIRAYSTLAEFCAEIQYKTVSGETTVYLNKDLSETVDIIGVSGVRLVIDGQGHNYFGKIYMSSCSCGDIVVQNISMQGSDADATLITVDGCQYVTLSDVKFYGNLTTAEMVRYDQSSSGSIIGCGFYDQAGNDAIGIHAKYAARLFVLNAKGGVHTVFQGAGCSVCWAGSRPLGTIITEAPYLSTPVDLSTLATDPGEGGGGGQTEPVTVTYYAASTRNCQGTGTWDSTSYAQTGITQNYYNSRYYKGCIWFDIDASVYAGKTIKSVSLRLYRPSTGYGTTGEITVKVIGLTFTYQQNLQQARTLPNATTGSIYTSNYYIDSTYSTFVEVGKIGRNQTMDFDLPITNGFIQNLLTNGGLCLFGGETTASSGHNYSNNYGQFAGAAPTNGAEYAPQLLITYV